MLADGEGQRFGASTDRREWIVDLVHNAGGERTDRGEFLRLSKALLRLAPFGDVLTDGNDMRHVGVVEVHWDLRDAIRPQLARCTRLDLELLNPPGREHVLKLAAEHLGGLSMQDLEDRATNRFLARHALEARLALAVPGLNAIRAVDHIQAHRQRVDDLFGESALLVDFARAGRHF